MLITPLRHASFCARFQGMQSNSAIPKGSQGPHAISPPSSGPITTLQHGTHGYLTTYYVLFISGNQFARRAIMRLLRIGNRTVISA